MFYRKGEYRLGHDHHIDFQNRGMLGYYPTSKTLGNEAYGASILRKTPEMLIKEEIVRRDFTTSELMNRLHFTSSWNPYPSHILRQTPLRESLPSRCFQSFAELRLTGLSFFKILFYFHLAIIPLWTYYVRLDSHDTTKMRILK